MVHYRRMVSAALHSLEEEARGVAVPIDLGTGVGVGGGGGGDPRDDADDRAGDDGSFRGATAQQVGATVLKLHVGDPELDRDDWYQRVRAALRGLTKDGQVDMLNLNRFRLAEDEGTVTWKLNVRFNDEELMQVEVLVSTNPAPDTPRRRCRWCRGCRDPEARSLSFVRPRKIIHPPRLPPEPHPDGPYPLPIQSQPTCTYDHIRELVRTKFGAKMTAERVRLRFNGAEVESVPGMRIADGAGAPAGTARPEATLSEAGVTDGSTLDLTIEPVEKTAEPEPTPEVEQVRKCSACLREKTQPAFTGRQWRQKTNVTRRCKECGPRGDEAMLSEVGVTDGSTLDLTIEPVEKAAEPEPTPVPQPEPTPAPTREISMMTHCACALCGLMKGKAEFSKKTWKELEASRICNDCMGKDITCVLCNLPRKWTDYGGTRQKSRKCDECCGIGKYAKALCCGCEKTRPKLHFANSQLKKSAQIRRCLVCQGTKEEEDLIIEPVEPEVEFKMCGGCMKAKGRSAFTSDRWGDRRDEKRRCKLCTNRDHVIAIEKDCACFVCDEMKGKADFSEKSWKLGYEKPEFRICIDCTGKDITCKMCNLSRKWTEYSTRMKKQCDECCGVGNYRKIMCGGCMRKRPKVDFATTQARKSPSSKRRCLVCQGKQKEVDSEDEELNRHEVVEKEALGDGGWNQGGDGWVNLVKESEDERAEEEDVIHLDSDDDDAYGQTVNDGFDENDGLDDDMNYGDPDAARRASLNGLLGLPDEQDAEFLERADYEKDSLSGDSHEDCELYGALHSQVFTFASTAGPDASDLQNRAVIQKKVREAIGTLYPASRLEVFGSGATGLALKCADIDLVVMGVGPEPCAGGGGFSRNDREELVRMLRKIEKALRREKIVWKANVISTAKVPIIKMNAGRYAVDLTVGASNGLSAVQWIKDQVRDFAAMQPIILVLKKLLKVHHLDDASTGGCGGYLLVSLVVSHLRQSGEPGRSSNPNLGALLLGFLRRFGYDFDYTRMAVAAGRASGVLRAKELTVGPGAFGRRPMILAEDPQVSVAPFLFFFFRFVSSSPRVCRVLDDGTPGAMIIIAFLVLSVGLASCSMKRLDSVPSLSARRRPADKPKTRHPSSFLFILRPLTLAFAHAGNRP